MQVIRETDRHLDVFTPSSLRPFPPPSKNVLRLSHCLPTLRCHGMRASRLHQGLRFLPIRCGFRVPGLKFKR